MRYVHPVLSESQIKSLWDGRRNDGYVYPLTEPSARAMFKAGVVDEKRYVTSWGREVRAAYAFCLGIEAYKHAFDDYFTDLRDVVVVVESVRSWAVAGVYFATLTPFERELGLTRPPVETPSCRAGYLVHPAMRSRLRTRLRRDYPNVGARGVNIACDALAYLLCCDVLARARAAECGAEIAAGV